jgi:hypothetical protein
LDAWAAERELGRRDEETPLEFVGRISRDVPDIAGAVQRLGQRYANLAYGRRRVPESARREVEEFWLGLETASPITTPAM